MIRKPSLVCIFLLCWALALTSPVWGKEKQESQEGDSRVLSFVDLMRMRTVEGEVISDDGRFVAYEARPDRGDGEVEIVGSDGGTRYRIERGTQPALSADGRYGAALVQATAAELHAAKDGDKKDADKPKNGLALLATSDGSRLDYANVASFAFSDDGQWLAIHHGEEPAEEEAAEEEAAEEAAAEEEAAEEEKAGEGSVEETASAAGEAALEGRVPQEVVGTEANPETSNPEAPNPEASSEEVPGEAAPSEEAAADDEEKDPREGTLLRLRRLADGFELEIPDVEAFAFAHDSGFLAYSVAVAEGVNGLKVQGLSADDGWVEPVTVAEQEGGRYSALAWAKSAADLAFVAAVDDEEGEPGDGTVWIFQGSSGEGSSVQTTDAMAEDWHVPSKNELLWSNDAARLYFGTRPRPKSKDDEEIVESDANAVDEAEAEPPYDPFDVEAILEETEVDVWHVDDPLIKTQERVRWDDEKDRTFLAVYHRGSTGRGPKVVPLANTEMRDISLRREQTVADGGGRAVIGVADVPYLKDRTWDGFFSDLYWVSLDDGEARRVASRLPNPAADLSPDGRYLAYYAESHWHLYDADTDQRRNLTEGLNVSFADEDDDYPAADPGYGNPHWLADATAVLLTDKYDLWRFPVDGGAPQRLTRGREDQLELRIVDLDPESRALASDASLLLEGYRHDRKTDGFWRLSLAEADEGPTSLLEMERRFSVKAKAKNADRLLYDRQAYTEFPDLWVADLDFGKARKLTEVNPQISDFAWGKAELVEWASDDGLPLQGVLIRPDSLDAAALERGERCPVLIYYYRFFSQRLHLFNDPRVNHRPSFPVYASDGYCVFLPDVRFEVGRPGLAAMKSVVPGVQKVVEMGVGDPDRLGLHGHSWSGYQTAFLVTQTNIFAAAVAGAPVSNMTSAYGGIRYGSGMARQFQYEQSQSRLGASLWESRDRYIENSPLFYADRIETPLLLMFGDADEAVPWTQGVELYLALRRLGKEAVFLQYRGEPHHPKKYGNKLDYSIKMKELFDHYLKDAPAPIWWTEGVPYEGDE